MSNEHLIDGPGQRPRLAEVGMRVARIHDTGAFGADFAPGTILRVGRKLLTVDFDDYGLRRVAAHNLVPWSEPRE